MEFAERIQGLEVDSTRNLINADDIAGIENELGVSLGDELTQYVLTYGYLGYKHVELYGINSRQKQESDMVIQTKYLHKYFPKTSGYIALENTGDGNYIMVSPKDEIIEFSSEDDRIQNTGKKMFDYIISRFQSVSEL